MNSPLPKQFMLMHDKPVLVHTMERFLEFDPTIQITVVMNPEYVEYWKGLCDSLAIPIVHHVVPGGAERFHSVLEGLKTISDENGLVAVHDAVRPLVSLKTIETCFQVASERGNAIPVIQVSDSLRHVDTSGSKGVDRSQFRIVQTPQVFQLDILRRAYQKPYIPSYTDDASVVESMGETIHLVQGNRENIKITDREDARMAEYFLSPAYRP